MNKWIDQFLEKDPCISTDRFNLNPNLSVLSVPHQGRLDQNLENVPPSSTDSTDIFNLNPNLSVLSVPIQGHLDQNLENMLLPFTDNTDKSHGEEHLSVLSDFSNGLSDNTPFYFSKTAELLDEYEERLAIAEYDGQQNSVQAQRIAYVDAFVSVLATLPYEDTEGDWLSYRINATKEWLLEQGINQH